MRMFAACSIAWAVALGALGTGCAVDRAPITIFPAAPGKSPAAPSTEDTTMQAKLEEIVAKAAIDPASQPDLTLLYERGHALSGTIRFALGADGHYELRSNVTGGRKPGSWQGTLTAAQHKALLEAASQGLLATPNSARNIGDDEEPVFVTWRDGALAHKLTLWHADAAHAPGFVVFERAVLGLLKQLSGGAILASAA